MKQTVREFMDTYEGFNWNNGTIVLTEGKRTKIFQKGEGDTWYLLFMEKYFSKRLLDWTHTDKIMSMVVK